MKKIIYALMAISFIFQSCTNNLDVNPDKDDLQNSEECITINTLDDLKNYLNQFNPVDDIIVEGTTPITKAAASWIEYCSTAGCNSVPVIALNQKFRFSADVASIIGVPANVEIFCDVRQGELFVAESSSYEVLRDTSLECGYVPGGVLTDLGYSMVRRNNNLVFLSNTLYVKNDVYGTTYNVHYPRMSEHFVWHFRRYHY